MRPAASVIVCSRNRAQLLARALRSLAHQVPAPAPFEVVLVDDGSSDDTPAVCRAMGQNELPNLRYVGLGRHVGLARARNAGVQAALGEQLLFMDDDCVAAADWVERMTAQVRRHPLVAGAVATTRDNYARLCHNIAQFYAFMPSRKAGPVDFIAGANMGCRRSVVEETGGFVQVFPQAEDMEFILRARAIGHRPFFAPEAAVTHLPDRTSLFHALRYAARHAQFTIQLRQEHCEMLRTPFVLRSPTLLLAASPLIALKVAAGIYGSDAALLRLWWTAPAVYAMKLAWCAGATRGLREYQARGARRTQPEAPAGARR